MFAECCVFDKQSQPPIHCGPLPLGQQVASRRQGAPSPEVTVLFCRVPSPDFSQAPWNTLPAHQCRFAVRSVYDWSFRGFSWKLASPASPPIARRLRPHLTAPQKGRGHVLHRDVQHPARLALSVTHRITHGYRNKNLFPIDYAFRPRLRGRLTQG